MVQLSPATLLLLYLQAFLVGIVVPDSEVMPGWAKKRGFEGTYAELCKNKVCICSTDFFFFFFAVALCVHNSVSRNDDLSGKNYFLTEHSAGLTWTQ